MTRKVKLTKAQAELLGHLGESGPRTVVAEYKPGIKLVELGLAEWHKGRFGTGILHITPSGRAYLSATREDAA